jgi:hypothetical protein
MAALDGTRTLSSGRDDFAVQWFVPSSTNSTLHTRAVDTTINLSITNQNPAGIVSGLYNQLTGGNLVTNVVIPAGQFQTPLRYVDVPTSPGTYTITGDVPGFVTSTSPTQTVVGPSVQFLLSNVVVGAGLTASTDFTFHTIGLARANLPSGNLTVNLACTPSTICSVPAQVTFTGSSSLAFFTVSGGSVGLGSVSVSGLPASYQTNTMSVDVRPPQMKFFNVPDVMSAGTSETFEIGIGILIPNTTSFFFESASANIVVTLTSSDPTRVAVPATITIAAGQSASPEIPIHALLPFGSSTITASAPGFATISTSVFVQP